MGGGGGAGGRERGGREDGVTKIRLVDPGFFFLKNPLQIYRDGKKWCEDVPTDLSLHYSGTKGIPLSLTSSLASRIVSTIYCIDD